MTAQQMPAALEGIIASLVIPPLRHAIRPDASLADDLRLDELAIMTIAHECDMHWLTEIPEEEWRGWRTLADVHRAIEQHAGVPV